MSRSRMYPSLHLEVAGSVSDTLPCTSSASAVLSTPEDNEDRLALDADDTKDTLDVSVTSDDVRFMSVTQPAQSCTATASAVSITSEEGPVLDAGVTDDSLAGVCSEIFI